MKGLRMSHGGSLIISKSKLNPEYREIFLSAKHFHEQPDYANFSSLTNWFDPVNPANEIDETVIKFLNDEQYDYTDKQIEYWFQDMTPGRKLMAHCDYNHKVREFNPGDGGQWIHTVKKQDVMSPITIACYLELDNMKGGDLVISEHTWFDEPEPLFFDEDVQSRVYSAPKHHFTPQVDDVVYFEGSKYYHWIEPLTQGRRKSMNINFWPRDYVIINTDINKKKIQPGT